MSRRSDAKYPALNPKLNLKGRRDYIEAEYVNGVYDENGKKVIRALNAEEKEWLNKFYQESVITSFKQDGTDLYSTPEKRCELYSENNARNRCLYNHLKKTGKLCSLESLDVDFLNPAQSDYFNPENIMLKLWEYGVSSYEELLKLIEKIENSN